MDVAEGWLMLGDWRSALEELVLLPPEVQGSPEALKLFIQALGEAKDWELLVSAAEKLVKAAPEDAAGWIHRSFALHEQRCTEEAFQLLEPALKLFPTHWLISYNLACYAAQLGRLTEARALLNRARMCGDQKEIGKLMAEDPDLAPLRNEAG